MQAAKDSFYIALRDRLATLNPERTITIAGEARPAILVAENMGVGKLGIAQNRRAPLADCFFVRFGAVRAADGFAHAPRPLLTMECTVAYRTAGSAADASGRGRALAALDTELLAICMPGKTVKSDFTQAPPADLGTTVTWERPQLGGVEDGGNSLEREARTTLFFFPE